MNKKSILFSLLIGVVFASYLFLKYNKKEEITYETIYMLQIGAYESYENVVKVTKQLDNYLVKEEDGVHKIIVGITKNEENLNKLKAFYEIDENNMYVREERINNQVFINYLTKYDYLMNETNSENVIKAINKEVINKYKEII